MFSMAEDGTASKMEKRSGIAKTTNVKNLMKGLKQHSAILFDVAIALAIHFVVKHQLSRCAIQSQTLGSSGNANLYDVTSLDSTLWITVACAIMLFSLAYLGTCARGTVRKNAVWLHVCCGVCSEETGASCDTMAREARAHFEQTCFSVITFSMRFHHRALIREITTWKRDLPIDSTGSFTSIGGSGDEKLGFCRRPPGVVLQLQHHLSSVAQCNWPFSRNSENVAPPTADLTRRAAPAAAGVVLAFIQSVPFNWGSGHKVIWRVSFFLWLHFISGKDKRKHLFWPHFATQPFLRAPEAKAEQPARGVTVNKEKSTKQQAKVRMRAGQTPESARGPRLGEHGA
ncbi:hypothetical protein C8R45DRAFT_944228 [Mycena sanguinolenta]|nr:hypothetical protein C8R45DRAFT_944228 [Mycena sanguinolenta]